MTNGLLYIALLFFIITTHTMENNEQTQLLLNYFQTAPPDIQKNIQRLMLYDTIQFLALQPTYLGSTSNGHTKCITSIATHDDFIITRSDDKTVKIWNIHTNELIRTFGDKDNPIDLIATHNNRIITKSHDKHKVKIWDIYTGDLFNTLKTPEHTFMDQINVIMLHDNLIAAGYFGGTIKIWDVNTQKLINTFIKSPLYVNSISALIIHDDIIITGSWSGAIDIWNIYTGKLLQSLTEQNGHESGISSLALYQNKMISGSWDSTAKIWNMHTKELIHTVSKSEKDGHTHWINAIAGENNKIATGSFDGTIKIWDMETGQLLRTITENQQSCEHEIFALALHNNKLITGSTHHFATIWPLSVSDDTISENPALYWIMHDANLHQVDFIRRAHNATIKNNELIIALPNKLNEITPHESSQQIDGRVYFTLPDHVRAYLRTHFTIRKK